MSKRTAELGRKAISYGTRIGVPERWLRDSIRVGKTIVNLRQAIRYRWHHRQLVERNPSDIVVPEERGYGRINQYQIPESEPAINEARELFESYRSRTNDPKPGLQNIFNSESLSEHESLVELALSNSVLGVAAEYLGTLPKLTTVHLWWTPPNDNKEGSQLFHLDSIDNRQIKFFFNINNVDESSGPFTCISSGRTDEIIRRFNTSYVNTKGMKDKEVLKICDRNDIIKATGPEGSGFAVDTSRCLHYGSRDANKDRVMLMIQFIKPFQPKEPKDSHGLEPEGVAPNDPVKQAVLS